MGGLNDPEVTLALVSGATTASALPFVAPFAPARDVVGPWAAIVVMVECVLGDPSETQPQDGQPTPLSTIVAL